MNTNALLLGLSSLGQGYLEGKERARRQAAEESERAFRQGLLSRQEARAQAQENREGQKFERDIKDADINRALSIGRTLLAQADELRKQAQWDKAKAVAEQANALTGPHGFTVDTSIYEPTLDEYKAKILEGKSPAAGVALANIWAGPYARKFESIVNAPQETIPGTPIGSVGPAAGVQPPIVPPLSVRPSSDPTANYQQWVKDIFAPDPETLARQKLGFLQAVAPYASDPVASLNMGALAPQFGFDAPVNPYKDVDYQTKQAQIASAQAMADYRNAMAQAAPQKLAIERARAEAQIRNYSNLQELAQARIKLQIIEQAERERHNRQSETISANRPVSEGRWVQEYEVQKDGTGKYVYVNPVTGEKRDFTGVKANSGPQVRAGQASSASSASLSKLAKQMAARGDRRDPASMQLIWKIMAMKGPKWASLQQNVKNALDNGQDEREIAKVIRANGIN